MDTTLAASLTGHQEARSWRERIDGALASLKDDLPQSSRAAGQGREHADDRGDVSDGG